MIFSTLQVTKGDNNMSQIIKPEGIELMEYLNEGYAICNKCGAVMDRKEHPRGGNDIYAHHAVGM